MMPPWTIHVVSSTMVTASAFFLLLSSPTVAAEAKASLHVWAEDPDGDIRNEYPPAEAEDHTYVDMLRILTEYNATRDMLAFVIEVTDASRVTERGSDWDLRCTAVYRIFSEDRLARIMTVGVESSAVAPATVSGVAYSNPPSQPTQQRQLYNESNAIFERPGVYSVTLERQLLMSEGDRIEFRTAVCRATIQVAGLLGFVIEDRNDNASTNQLDFSEFSPQSGPIDDIDDGPIAGERDNDESPEKPTPSPAVAYLLIGIGIAVALRRQRAWRH